MSKRHEPQTVADGEQQVLDFLETGIHTWEEIRRATKPENDQVGLVLIELLDRREDLDGRARGREGIRSITCQGCRQISKLMSLCDGSSVSEGAACDRAFLGLTITS